MLHAATSRTHFLHTVAAAAALLEHEENGQSRGVGLRPTKAGRARLLEFGHFPCAPKAGRPETRLTGAHYAPSKVQKGRVSPAWSPCVTVTRGKWPKPWCRPPAYKGGQSPPPGVWPFSLCSQNRQARDPPYRSPLGPIQSSVGGVSPAWSPCVTVTRGKWPKPWCRPPAYKGGQSPPPGVWPFSLCSQNRQARGPPYRNAQPPIQ